MSSPNTSTSHSISSARIGISSWQWFPVNEKQVKLSTYIDAVCALRFFYENTLHQRIETDRIALPRYKKRLPVILSKAGVKVLLEAPKSLKHRASLATMYGAGLRVSEVTSLKLHDLDRERRVICVRGGKGHDDRQVMLAEPLREVLAATVFQALLLAISSIREFGCNGEEQVKIAAQGAGRGIVINLRRVHEGKGCCASIGMRREKTVGKEISVTDFMCHQRTNSARPDGRVDVDN